MGFWCYLDFPMRLLDDEIWKLICTKHGYEETQVPQDALSVNASRKGIAHVEDETSIGRFEELEALLIRKQIPFDRYCSEGDGDAPDYGVYRPDMLVDKTVLWTYDGDEFLTREAVEKALKAPDDKLRETLIDTLKQYTHYGIEPIENFTHATELGRDTQKMSAIDQVLARLDNGEIDDASALQLIADIRKGEQLVEA